MIANQIIMKILLDVADQERAKNSGKDHTGKLTEKSSYNRIEKIHSTWRDLAKVLCHIKVSEFAGAAAIDYQ